MKFEIRINSETVTNTFIIDSINTCKEIDTFIDDGKSININSKIEKVNFDGSKFIKESSHLIGMVACTEIILEKFDYAKRFLFSDFINFLSNLYYEDEEIEVEIIPIDSKYYGKHIDLNYTDDEADEADEERFFFSHMENEIESYLNESDEVFEALESLFDSSFVPVFQTKELEEQYEEIKVKRWILASIREALEETYSNYDIDI